jgi:hypothetical protein
MLLLLTSCSRQKSISIDQLRSEFVSAISFASEAETLIDYVGQSRSTRNYAKGHVEYLADAISDSVKELRDGVAPQSVTSQAQVCSTQLNSLANELNAVGQELGDTTALARSRERIAEIRKVLEKASSSF